MLSLFHNLFGSTMDPVFALIQIPEKSAKGREWGVFHDYKRQTICMKKSDMESASVRKESLFPENTRKGIGV